MKALGLVVSDKKIFENCILKTYLLTLWPTYAINWNNLNNFDRGPPRDHSCEVWSKSNERFQRRRCLSKQVYARRTTDDARRTTDDDGRRTKTDHNSSPWALWRNNFGRGPPRDHSCEVWSKSTLCSGELKSKYSYLYIDYYGQRNTPDN